MEYYGTIRENDDGACEIGIEVKDVIEGTVSLPYMIGEKTMCTIPASRAGSLIEPSDCTGDLYTKISQYTSAYFPENYGVDSDADEFDCKKSSNSDLIQIDGIWVPVLNETRWAECHSLLSDNIRSCKATTVSFAEYPQSGDGNLTVTISIGKEHRALSIRQEIERNFMNYECRISIMVHEVYSGSVQLPYEPYERSVCTIPAEHVIKGIYGNEFASCTGDLIDNMEMYTAGILP